MNKILLQQLKSKWVGLIRSNSMIENGCHLLHQIERTGHQALIVGGSVRDLVAGGTPHDIDIATNAPLSVLDSIFCTYDIGASRDNNTVLVNRGGHSFEITQFRGENNTFWADARLRDFNINAMGITKEGDIIDHFQGIRDINDKFIDTVNNPQLIFTDDPLRMMRAVRFSIRLGFQLSNRVQDSIISNSGLLRHVSPERIKDELWKMAEQDGSDFAETVDLMNELDILNVILPEVVALRGVFESKVHHPEAHQFGFGRVWDHVLHALRQNTEKGNSLLNIAILFHDLGKAETFEEIDGKLTFHNHDSVGGEIIKRVAIRLKLSREDREALIFPAVSHMKLFRGHEMKPSKVVRLVNNPNWQLLKTVSLCDDKCRGPQKFNLEHFNSVISRMETTAAIWNERLKRDDAKVVDGKEVMALCGIEKSGRIVGDNIREVSEFVINNDITDQSLIEELVRFSYKLLTKE